MRMNCPNCNADLEETDEQLALPEHPPEQRKVTAFVLSRQVCPKCGPVGAQYIRGEWMRNREDLPSQLHPDPDGAASLG